MMETPLPGSSGIHPFPPRPRALPRQELVSEKRLHPSEHLCFQPGRAPRSCPIGSVQLKLTNLMADIFQLGKGGRSKLPDSPRGAQGARVLAPHPWLSACRNPRCSEVQCESTLIYAASSVPSLGVTFSPCLVSPMTLSLAATVALTVAATSGPSAVGTGLSPPLTVSREPGLGSSVPSVFYSVPVSHHHIVSKGQLSSPETVPPTATPSLASGQTPCPPCVQDPRVPPCRLGTAQLRVPVTKAVMGMTPRAPRWPCLCLGP